MTPTANNGGNGKNGGFRDEFDDEFDSEFDSEFDAATTASEATGGSKRKRDRRGFDDFDDDFDDLIRDPEYVDADPSSDPFESFTRDWDDPATSRGHGNGRSSGSANGVTDAILHLVEMVAGTAGDALPPDTRRRLEGMLRDLLIALRDSLDKMIDRLEERTDYEVEIEEIHFD